MNMHVLFYILKVKCCCLESCKLTCLFSWNKQTKNAHGSINHVCSAEKMYQTEFKFTELNYNILLQNHNVLSLHWTSLYCISLWKWLCSYSQICLKYTLCSTGQAQPSLYFYFAAIFLQFHSYLLRMWNIYSVLLVQTLWAWK